MFYLAVAFIIATSLFALMRITLRHKKIQLQQFFILYFLALIGLLLLFLGVTGRLHWLFALIGAILPFFSGLTRWGLRLWRAAGIFQSLRGWLNQLTGLTSEQNRKGVSPSGPMTYQQALDILGLEARPTEEQIKAAHRRLIQKVHPDRGGSTLLAAQINEAKQVLLDHV